MPRIPRKESTALDEHLREAKKWLQELERKGTLTSIDLHWVVSVYLARKGMPVYPLGITVDKYLKHALAYINACRAKETSPKASIVFKHIQKRL